MRACQLKDFYIDAPLKTGQPVSLEGQEFHHLSRVMRIRVGEPIELVNGRGVLAEARLEALSKHTAHLAVLEVHTVQKPTQERILAQGLPRSNRLDFIVEKGTELGMTALWLFPGERSERKEVSPQQLERIQSLLIAAMKQCRRLWLPEVHLKPPLKEWKEIPATAFFGDVNPNAPRLWQALPKNSTDILFYIGPEAGLTEKEERMLISLHALGVKLNDHILRTDTAAITALALMQIAPGP